MRAPEGRAGTPDSFTEFVHARRRALLRTAYLMCGDAHDAEDLVQVALAKAVPRWRRIEDDPEPYVRTILVRENIDRWRRRRWRELPSDAPPEHFAPAHDPDTRVSLHRALGDLAPRQRAVVVLRYLEDLSEAQTARVLGCSVGTVKSQAHDGLRRLRLAVPDLAPPDPVREEGPTTVAP